MSWGIAGVSLDVAKVTHEMRVLPDGGRHRSWVRLGGAGITLCGCGCSLAGADPEERVTTGQLLLQSFYEDQDRAMRLGGLHHSSLSGLPSASVSLVTFMSPPKTFSFVKSLAMTWLSLL